MKFLSVFILFVIIFPLKIFAMELHVGVDDNNFDISEFKSIDVNFECENVCKSGYLKGLLYKSNGKYFGLTQNNAGEWIVHQKSESNIDSFFEINGEYSGKLII